MIERVRNGSEVYVMAEKRCPALLRLSGRLCVIVGGGRGAAVKARSLSCAGARLRIIAESVSDEIKELDAEIIQRRCEPGDTEDAFIVFALTGNAETDEMIKNEARRGGALVGGEDILLPACAEGENITAFVSTGYPKLSAELMRDILKYDSVCGLLKRFRERVNRSPAEQDARDKLLAAAVTDEALETAVRSIEEYKEYLGRLEQELSDNIKENG